MSKDLDDKIEALAQEMAAKFGVTLDCARAMLRSAVYAPPTSQEIADALAETSKGDSEV